MELPGSVPGAGEDKVEVTAPVIVTALIIVIVTAPHPHHRAPMGLIMMEICSQTNMTPTAIQME